MTSHTYRPRPGSPAPQVFGAVAVLERDDRAAIFGRVSRCRPGTRGNKTRRAVQAGRGNPYTWRIASGTRGAAVTSSQRSRLTCSETRTGRTHVLAAHGRASSSGRPPVHSHVPANAAARHMFPCGQPGGVHTLAFGIGVRCRLRSARRRPVRRPVAASVAGPAHIFPRSWASIVHLFPQLIGGRCRRRRRRRRLARSHVARTRRARLTCSRAVSRAPGPGMPRTGTGGAAERSVAADDGDIAGGSVATGTCDGVSEGVMSTDSARHAVAGFGRDIRHALSGDLVEQETAGFRLPIGLQFPLLSQT